MTAPPPTEVRRSIPAVLWRVSIFVGALAVLILVATGWTRWEGRPGWQKTDDAYLQADLTPILSRVAGYVAALPAQDFQRVRTGEVIAQIVDADYRASAAQAAANVASANAQAAALQAQMALQTANVAAAAAGVAATEADRRQNSRDLARQQQLFTIGASSTEAREKLETAKEQLAARIDQDRAQLEAARRQLGVLAANLAQAQAAIAAQTAALDLARINLSYTRIVAPQDGVLGQRQIKPGQYVSAGAQITSLTPLPRVWVIANFKETQLTHVSVGQAAEVRVDAFPGAVLKGHVLAIAPGSGAQFALLPPDNATGNFTKVVQRVAVKIAIDDAAGLGARLRPGLSVTARVDAREAPR